MFSLPKNMHKLRETITRQHIFEKFPWLKQRDLYMVTHNDYDGILTAIILHALLGWKLVGIYDLERLWITPNYKGDIQDLIFVDLDVTKEGFRSIGHHIIDEEQDSLNINQLFSIEQSKYKEKFPLSTALFLYWLYELPFPEKVIQQLFIIHSDSVWKNYVDYTDNVTHWLELLELNPMLDILQNFNFVPTIHKYVLPHMYGRNHQCSHIISKTGECQFKQAKEPFQSFIDKMAKVLELDTILYPTNLEERMHFNRMAIKVSTYKFKEELKEIKKRYPIFSYSLKYKDTLDISYST